MNYYLIENGTLNACNAHLADEYKLKGFKDGKVTRVADWRVEAAMAQGQSSIPAEVANRVWESDQITVTKPPLSFKAEVDGKVSTVTIYGDYEIE